MLGNYKGSPFIVGDSILQHNRLEIMNLETRTWEEFESYPYTREWVVHNFSATKYILNYFSIYLYATASYDDSVFIFGGYSQYDGRIQSTIAKYDGQWSKVGDLGSVSRDKYKTLSFSFSNLKSCPAASAFSNSVRFRSHDSRWWWKVRIKLNRYRRVVGYSL